MPGVLRLAAAALVLALSGCSDGASCDELPALTQERDAARQESARLQTAHDRGEATEEQLDAAHDRTHDLDTRVFDLSQKCD